jgi:hypothetical protein
MRSPDRVFTTYTANAGLLPVDPGRNGRAQADRLPVAELGDQPEGTCQIVVLVHANVRQRAYGARKIRVCARKPRCELLVRYLVASLKDAHRHPTFSPTGSENTVSNTKLSPSSTSDLRSSFARRAASGASIRVRARDCPHSRTAALTAPGELRTTSTYRRLARDRALRDLSCEAGIENERFGELDP